MDRHQPVFLYLDLDEFFVQVERLAAPALASRPVLIGGLPGGRGEVACASLEAREHGIRAGMQIREALRRCPDAVVLPCHPARIHDLSFRFFRLLLRWSPNVEKRSVDEAWVDLSEKALSLHESLSVAGAIQGEIREELGLAVSVGIGPSGTIAHRACQASKPAGRLAWDHESYRAWSSTAGIEALPGVGPVFAGHFLQAGMRTVADLARCADPRRLRSIAGERGVSLAILARGEDPRPLIPVHASHPSARVTRTLSFPRPLKHPPHLARVLLVLAEEISRELREEGFRAARITLALFHEGGGVERRSQNLSAASPSTDSIAAVLHRLQKEIGCEVGVRSLTIGVTRGEDRPPAQEELFSSDPGSRSDPDGWDRASDRITERFGRRSLRRASMLPSSKGDR
jgi:DNA polymerase-4